MNRSPKADDEFPDKEAQERFDAALRGAMKSPHKPLKAKKAKAKKAPKPDKKS